MGGFGTWSNVPTCIVVNVVDHYNQIHVSRPSPWLLLVIALQVRVQDVQVAMHITEYILYFELPCCTCELNYVINQNKLDYLGINVYL